MFNSSHYIDEYEDSNNTRYSELMELKEDYSWNRYEDDTGQKGGLSVHVDQDSDGNIVGALVDGSDTNSIIISSTGAGKTTRILCPYILNCVYAKEDMLIHDPKGELYKYFYNVMIEHGYDIQVINLRDPKTGSRYNPLQRAAKMYKAGNESKAEELASDIAISIFMTVENKDDLFWTVEACDLFVCYFLICCELYEPEYVTFKTILRVHLEGIPKIGSATTAMHYLNAHKDKSLFERGLDALTSPSETKGGIFAVFSAGIRKMIVNDDIADTLTSSTIEVDKMIYADKPTAMFIITRDEAPDTYAQIVSTIVYDIYSTLIEEAEKTDELRLDRTFHFVLEEFGNLSKLKNVDQMFSAARSRNIRLVAVIQSLFQLYMKYSEAEAKTLLGNASDLVYLHSTDSEMVDYISKKCGTVYDSYTGKMESLLNPNRLTHFDKSRGQALILLERKYPYVTFFPYVDRYSMIKPLKRVELEERQPLDLHYGKLTEAVKEILKNRNEPLKSDNAMPQFGFGRDAFTTPSIDYRALENSMDKIIEEIKRGDT